MLGQTALTILRFLVFFLAFYVVNSVTINCFNYVELGGKSWVNILVLALFNALGVIVYNIIQYSLFFKNGVMPFRGNLGLGISGIWGYCAIFYLTMTPLVTRFIYKHTKNPLCGRYHQCRCCHRHVRCQHHHCSGLSRSKAASQYNTKTLENLGSPVFLYLTQGTCVT